MRKTTQHLNDEHMQLYEWSGTGAGITLSLPARSKRTHPWHASYAVLAVLTSLLILNGCDNKGAAPKTQEQVGQAAPGMQEEAAAPKADAAPQPEASPGQAPAQAGDQSGQPGEGGQKP